jgi:hypothetical protein
MNARLLHAIMERHALINMDIMIVIALPVGLVLVVKSTLMNVKVRHVGIMGAVWMKLTAIVVNVIKASKERTVKWILMNVPVSHVRMEDNARMDTGSSRVLVTQAGMELSVK